MILSSHVIAASLECFHEKPSWCRNEQICQRRKSAKRFERSNGLDMHLIKSTFFTLILPLTVSCCQDVAEVASCQVRAFETHQESRDKEIMSLRQQLVDFQAQSDEKTVIGEIHLVCNW